MSAHKRTIIALILSISCLISTSSVADAGKVFTREEIARELGWIDDPLSFCGGYYLESPFPYAKDAADIHITSNQGFFAMRSTSVLEKEVTIIRGHEEITANRAFLYRDPANFKLKATDMIGDVHLREPNTLIIAHRGHYDFQTDKKSLLGIIYRTGLIGHNIAGPSVNQELMLSPREISSMTAWGTAYEYAQSEPNVYDMNQTTYSTCPPKNPTWEVAASKITLNKNTGRGYARNARLYIKDIPVLYAPYFEFSIDRQRKSGFLWPIAGLGSGSNKFGPYLLLPFYWNMAPNYDMTITPGILSHRGVQILDDFRYLTTTSHGEVNFSFIPYDRQFALFQEDIAAKPYLAESPSTVTQSEFNRLQSDPTTRMALFYRDDSQFSPNWSSHIDFNYASDDYYLKNFGTSLNETTANQLLEEAELNYKSLHWNMTGRLQGYQTLHPIEDNEVANQYRRFPQLVIGADYPNEPFGLEYFLNSELTHFVIRNNPGTPLKQPIGNRLHAQAGISWPFTQPYFFFNPRVQLALTQYQLYQTAFTDTKGTKHRALPIVDVMTGMAFNRESYLFGEAYRETLEPQLYYVYIPYRNQVKIPNFDTTVKSLTYDQLFSYNRFSGIDRIGDANQVAIGVTSRFIDERYGFEKVRMGMGMMVYFKDREVTFCNDKTCTDNPSNDNNKYTLSPLVATVNYHVNPYWVFSTNSIWNTTTKQIDNATVSFHYQPDIDRVLTLGFTFARNGDYFTGLNIPTSQNNLKLTDISFAWPLTNNVSVFGRWTEDWNTSHFQNILYGLQYDTCCWALRFVSGRTFTGLDQKTGSRNYSDATYLEFNLKGLANIGSGNPNGLLSTISGYKNTFGQEN